MKKLIFLATVVAFLFLISTVQAQEFVIHDSKNNIVKTGDLVFKIHQDYLSQYVDVKIKPKDKSCYLVKLIPKEKLKHAFKNKDKNPMQIANDFKELSEIAKEKNRNIISDIKSLNRVPIKSIHNVVIHNIKKQNQIATLDLTDENEFELCNIAKGAYVSFGFATTNITIENSTFHIQIDPETNYCLTDCEHEIQITNKDNVSHEISINNITIENPEDMQNIQIYYDKPVTDVITKQYRGEMFFEENTTSSLCQIENENYACYEYNETYCQCQKIWYEEENVTVYRKTPFSSYSIPAESSVTLYIDYHVPLDSSGKYNITFFFNGEYYNIDPYWNSSWQYRRQINITNLNTTHAIPSGQVVHIVMDTTGDKFRDDGQDVRIVYDNGSYAYEINRWNITPFNSSSTRIYFNTQVEIPASGYDDNYYVYYGNPSATNPMDDKNEIFNFTDDFNSGINWTTWCGATCGGCWQLDNSTSDYFVNGDYCGPGANTNFHTNTLRWGNMTERIYKFRYPTSMSDTRGPMHYAFSLNAQSRFSPYDGHVCVHCGDANANSGYYNIQYNTWYWADIKRGGWNVPLEIDVNWQTVVVNDSATYADRLTYERFGWSVGENTGHEMDIDEVYIFDYFYPEPSLSLSAEETQTDAISIGFVFPTPFNNTITDNNTITINATSNATLTSCLLEWSGVNESMTVSGSYCYITKSSLPDGTYQYRVHAFAGSSYNATQYQTITIDTTPPSVIIYSPLNTTYTTSPIDVKVYSPDAAIWFYSFNGYNTTFTPNTTITPVEGLNELTIIGVDIAGNANLTTIMFTYSPPTEQPLMSAHPELLILPFTIVGTALYVIFSMFLGREFSIRSLIAVLLFAVLLLVAIGFMFTVTVPV